MRFSIFIISSLVYSCGGISIAEHQDASTLRRGQVAFSSSASTGPEEWGKDAQSRFFKGVSPSLVEPRLTFGLSDRVDFGMSLWSGFLGPKIVSAFVIGNSGSAIDIGLKGMLKYRFTSDASNWHFALLTNYTEYFIAGSSSYRVARGISPGLIVSRPVLDDYGIYGITKFNIFKIGNRYSPFPSTHLGMTQIVKQTKWHFELIYSYVRPPLSDGRRGHVLTISGGRTWNLN